MVSLSLEPWMEVGIICIWQLKIKLPYTDTNVKLGGTDQKWVLKEEECGKAYKIRWT